MRNARPGRASVIVPWSRTSSPLTITESIPAGAARVRRRAAIGNGLGIEDDEIGLPSGRDDAAIGEAETARPNGRSSSRSLPRARHVLLANVAREHARKRAVASRMAAGQLAVRADQRRGCAKMARMSSSSIDVPMMPMSGPAVLHHLHDERRRDRSAARRRARRACGRPTRDPDCSCVIRTFAAPPISSRPRLPLRRRFSKSRSGISTYIDECQYGYGYQSPVDVLPLAPRGIDEPRAPSAACPHTGLDASFMCEISTGTPRAAADLDRLAPRGEHIVLLVADVAASRSRRYGLITDGQRHQLVGRARRSRGRTRGRSRARRRRPSSRARRAPSSSSISAGVAARLKSPPITSAAHGAVADAGERR